MHQTRQNQGIVTDQLHLRDAYLRTFAANVVDVRDDGAVALDRTAFYATGGGQPHDTGLLRSPGGPVVPVTSVQKDGSTVWHVIDQDGSGLSAADEVTGEINWARRHALMRTHTALHVLSGVIWLTWAVPVTGGSMEPLSARMDFELDPTPEHLGPQVEELVNAELAKNRPIEVSFLPRGVALSDADLIRTKVNLIPESVSEIRVVDIVGLDKQADGGTHVRSTAEVGRIRVVKTESKGKGNKRIRIEIVPAPGDPNG
jgi:misacylated tRNA(Ala) deacylase